MSKSNIRKISADPTKCNPDPRRPSVFERLGTKPTVSSAQTSDYCRNWAQTGNCSYGKNCKYANTHTLISPSKRVKKENATTNPPLLLEDPYKRLTSKIVKSSPDLNLEEWNQTDLEYEDEKVLERRRQLLQRELELQMRKDKEVHGKDKMKYKKKVMSSSSSSRSSTSSSSSSSSSSDDSSSSSASDSRKKVKKFKKKHSASPEFDDKERKRKAKSPLRSGSHGTAPKPKERTRSVSPKLKQPQQRESDKERLHKKLQRDGEEATGSAKEQQLAKKSAATDQQHRGERSERSDRQKESDSRSTKTRLLDLDKGRSAERSRPREGRRSRSPRYNSRDGSRTKRSRSRDSRIKLEPLPPRPAVRNRSRDADNRLRDRDRNRDKSKSRKSPLLLGSRPRSRERRSSRDKERDVGVGHSLDKNSSSSRYKDSASRKDSSRERRDSTKTKDTVGREPLPPPPSKDHHLADRDSGRHRGPRGGGVGSSATGGSSSSKRSDSPRGGFERAYARLGKNVPAQVGTSSSSAGVMASGVGSSTIGGSEHWPDQTEDSSVVLTTGDYDADGRRKRYESGSPFGTERSGRGARNSGVGIERGFDDAHHLPPRIRDEGPAENWDVHHDLDRERPYGPPGDWEDREWRARGTGWERDGLSRGDAHDDEWAGRYESGHHLEPRKWDNTNLHGRGSYRGDRVKELEIPDSSHGKRRGFGTPERREELPSHAAKQALHNSMKDEPINKKLMELAEGRPRRSREKSTDSGSFAKKLLPKEKSEAKEPPPLPPLPPPEPKRIEEPMPALLAESDLSDISDDPDDILDMEEDIIAETRSQVGEVDSAFLMSQDLSPRQALDEGPFTKEREATETYSSKNTIEDESMETMDFEEISDGELEEDVKTSCKGLGDALGVDWESLVKESQPRRSTATSHDNVQDRWQCKAVFQRIGISVKAAGQEFVQTLLRKYVDKESDQLLLNDIAFVHTALARKQCLPNSMYKLVCNDDLLYRNRNDNDIDNAEDFKPCVSLYEEAKMLLQQTA
ncbi:hypothetical protein QAD02_016946 [Eretmocerus hayati]|uniref:Uncharacterized protein n=1 Tax=Eretmocerus hayati TaxID=131215 RepID=A0ACC2PC07_9HYME|nr:hypothetical protein QAD02_016946 [Eretmocerus hayati]